MHDILLEVDRKMTHVKFKVLCSRVTQSKISTGTVYSTLQVVDQRKLDPQKHLVKSIIDDGTVMSRVILPCHFTDDLAQLTMYSKCNFWSISVVRTTNVDTVSELNTISELNLCLTALNVMLRADVGRLAFARCPDDMCSPEYQQVAYHCNVRSLAGPCS